MWGKISKILEWVGHGSTAVQIAGWVGLPTTGFTVWAMTFFGSAVEGWSVTGVWLASLGAGLMASAIYAAIAIGVAYHRYAVSDGLAPATQQVGTLQISQPVDGLHEFIPDVRVADSSAALNLFDDDKLIALLEQEKIIAWARPNGSGSQPLITVPGNIWRTHNLKFLAKGEDDPRRINQTFIQTKTTNQTAYFDLFLNSSQLKRIWANFEYVTPSPVVPWPDFDKWDKRTNFRLFEIACLWTDREPSLPLTAEAVQCFKVLEQAIWDKHLKIRSESVREAIVGAIAISKGRESKANPNWVIDKDALLLYAAGRNEKPRFLFPEERV